MDKKLLAYICIAALVIFGLAVFLSLYFKSQDLNFQGRRTPLLPPSVFNDVDHSPRYASGVNLTAGICALLLVGYLFWVFYLKYKKDGQADLLAMENSLYKISLATGRTEYELFHKSAEGWSVAGHRIDEDFKRYMADQVLPYYARDFVRKNHKHIDESLIIKEEVEPTSLWDWAKALLVFPGCFFILVSMALLLGRIRIFSY